MRVRNHHKHTGVAAQLRRSILSGDLSPGARMPTRREVEQSFDASRMTIQQAFDRLVHDGFIVTRGAAGTFVADNPPHICNYALAFYNHPAGSEYERFSRFSQALNAAANDYTDTDGRTITAFYNCNGLRESADYCQLMKDLHAQRVAGIIFAFPLSLLPDSPLVTAPGLPRVGIAGGDKFGIPCVNPDHNDVLRRAVAHLAGRGKQRIATIDHEQSLINRKNTLFEAMNAHGLPVVPYWHQYQNHLYAETTYNSAYLLFNPQQTEHPDALIVADDNLAAAAVAGVAAAGVRVPEEVEIVVHCNWPLPPKTVLPVTRIGFDTAQLLDAYIRNLDAQRAGVTPPGMTLIPAIIK